MTRLRQRPAVARTGAIRQKVGEKGEKTAPVAPENSLYRWRLFRIRNKYLCKSACTYAAYLEHMKGLKLDILALVTKCIHCTLQVFFVSNESNHDRVVRAIDQQLAE